jgi:hypothetical protein
MPEQLLSAVVEQHVEGQVLGVPHFPQTVPVSPRHSEPSPDSSPTLTLAPICPCSDLMRASSFLRLSDFWLSPLHKGTWLGYRTPKEHWERPRHRRERSAFRYPSHSFPCAGLLLSYKGVRESVRWGTLCPRARSGRPVGCMVLWSYQASRIEFPPPCSSGPASNIPGSHPPSSWRTRGCHRTQGALRHRHHTVALDTLST